MSRLNKEIKSKIANECVTTQFEERKTLLSKEEHKLGMELYKSAFDAKVLTAAAKLPDKWLRMDACLRFNCGGYDMRLTVNKAVPVPYSADCSRLANIAGELADKAQEWAKKKDKLRDEINGAFRALSSMLESVSTTNQLEKAWPEGKKFYTKYSATAADTNLPALQVSEVNKLLGLAA